MSQLYNYQVGGVRVSKAWEWSSIPITNFVQYDGPPVPSEVKTTPSAVSEPSTESGKKTFLEVWDEQGGPIIIGDPMFSPGWWMGIYTSLGVGALLGWATRGVLGGTPVLAIARKIQEALAAIS